MNQRQVSFGQAITLFFKNYVNFSGRSSRSEYWWVALAIAITYIPFYFLSYKPMMWIMALGENQVGYTDVDAGWIAIWSIVFGIIYLAILLPGLAIICRRLHDIGKGAGWIFIQLVPFIGSIWLLVLMLQPSQPGTNRFGPEPNVY